MFSNSVSCKSTPSSNNNNYNDSLTWGGLKRTYLIHLPQHYNKNAQKPLVIVLHGGGGNGKGMIRLTNFNTLADKEDFIVVYPYGIDKHWNDGREGSETSYTAHINKIDDVGFISALIDKLAVELNIDTKRVYVCGISNGAMMSYRLACELTKKIAAIAAIAGNMPKNLVCNKNSQHIPVLIISGTDDPLMPFNGGNITGPFGNKKLGQVLSLKETALFWSKFNNCSLSPMVSYEPDKDSNDGTRVRKEIYRGDTNSKEVVVYLIEKGGHTWPGGYQYLPETLIGKTSKDINATELIWDFFKTHPKR
jgi:polyhydroxybutyrate depolymerase